MQYNPPFGTPPNTPFIDGNPVAGVQGSIPPAASIEYPQREIVAAIVAAGLTATNNDLTQLTQAIEILSRIPYCLDQGIVNTISIDPPIAQLVYSSPMLYIIKVAYPNTGPTTVSVSGLPARQLLKPNGTQLLQGDICGLILVAFDGVNFELLSPPQSIPAAPVVIHYGPDASDTINQITATVDGTVTAYTTPLWFGILPANANSGPCFANINGIGQIRVTRGAGNNIVANDIVAGTMAFLFCDGVELQLVNPQQLNAGSGGGGGGGYPPDWNDILGQLNAYWLTVVSDTTLAQPMSPSTGDTYIVPPGATGGWSSVVGKVAQWTGITWVYRTYPMGTLLSSKDTSRFYQFNGTTWNEVQIPTMGRLFFYMNQ